MAPDEPLRFADILTTASAVANYRGESDVQAQHLLDAIDILQGAKTLDDLGRPVSPLVRRTAPPGASDDVKALVQRWFATIGSDPNAMLDAEKIARLQADIRTIIS